MESLVSYGSDDEQDLDNLQSSMGRSKESYREREHEDNYDNVGMDMSDEESNNNATPPRSENRYGKDSSTSRHSSSTCRNDYASGRDYSDRYSRKSSSDDYKQSPKKYNKYRDVHKTGSSSYDYKEDQRDRRKEKRSQSRDRRRSSSIERKRDKRRSSRSPKYSRRRSKSTDRRVVRSGSRDRRSRERRDRSRSREYEKKSRRDRKDRSRSREHIRSKRSASRDNTRNRSRSRERKEQTSRSPPRYKGRFDRTTNKLAVLEKLGIEIKTPDSQFVTPQMLMHKTMNDKIEEVKNATGIELPKYYNPAVMNPSRYAEQIQKRRLLWGNKSKPSDLESSSNTNNTTGSTSTAAVAAPATTVEVPKLWQQTKFVHDNDGKVASKFKRLMGIKDDVTQSKELTNSETLKKQEEMFHSMEAQYEVARAATHTMRGVGLGFGAFTGNFPR